MRLIQRHKNCRHKQGSGSQGCASAWNPPGEADSGHTFTLHHFFTQKTLLLSYSWSPSVPSQFPLYSITGNHCEQIELAQSCEARAEGGSRNPQRIQRASAGGVAWHRECADSSGCLLLLLQPGPPGCHRSPGSLFRALALIGLKG